MSVTDPTAPEPLPPVPHIPAGDESRISELKAPIPDGHTVEMEPGESPATPFHVPPNREESAAIILRKDILAPLQVIRLPDLKECRKLPLGQVALTTEQRQANDDAKEQQEVKKSEVAILRYRNWLRKSDMTADAIRIFLEYYSKTGLMYLACHASSISAHTIKEMRKTNPWFDRECDRAKNHSNEILEKEAMRRAHDGWDEAVYAKDGTLAGYVRKYDSRLMELMLKSRNAAFRDKLDANINVSGGVLIAPGVQKTAEDWRKTYQPGPDDVEGEVVGEKKITGGNNTNGTA